MKKKLSELPEGGSAKVIKIEGGHGAVSKLHSMGVVKDTEIRVVQSSGRGPIIVIARGTKLALGRGMAEKVIVK